MYTLIVLNSVNEMVYFAEFGGKDGKQRVEDRAAYWKRRKDGYGCVSGDNDYKVYVAQQR